MLPCVLFSDKKICSCTNYNCGKLKIKCSNNNVQYYGSNLQADTVLLYSLKTRT